MSCGRPEVRATGPRAPQASASSRVSTPTPAHRARTVGQDGSARGPRGRDRTEVGRRALPSCPTVRARCAGVGVLTRDEALAWGALGPVARTSGLPQDIRKAEPYAIYDRLDFEVPVRPEGDVLARIVVRALEIVESCCIIEQAVESMPAGPIDAGDFIPIPAGEACARIEGPRGEVFYYVASDGSDVPLRVRIRTPTFQNMPTVALMIRRQTLADVPLIQASIDPCYSCTDR